MYSNNLGTYGVSYNAPHCEKGEIDTELAEQEFFRNPPSIDDIERGTDYEDALDLL